VTHTVRIDLTDLIIADLRRAAIAPPRMHIQQDAGLANAIAPPDLLICDDHAN
jgi:hypothetical protein